MSDSFISTCLAPTRVVWQPSDNSTASAGKFLLQGDSGGLILDFGRELYGGVEISIGAVSGAEISTLRLRFGESVSEVAGPAAYYDGCQEIRSNSQTYFGDTGFRFIRMEILEAGARADVLDTRAVSVQWDIPYKGSFRCSDQRLNEIWSVGASTVHLCMQTALWDGLKRGQAVWAGDLFPASMVVSAVFGELPIVTASLDEVRDRTLVDGREEPSWMNGIGSYSLWWLLTQHRWFLYHGNRGYLEEQRAYLARLLAKLFRSIDPSGRESLDGWRFLDWATEDEKDVHAGFQSLFVLAMRAAIDLCVWLGEESLGARCHACLSQLQNAPPQVRRNKQASALMALAGYGEPVAINRDMLAVHPLKDLTPFLAYPVLEARALANDTIGCLELIRAYWGGMLDMGATSFWEDFDESWIANTTRIDELQSDRRRQFPQGFGRCSSGVRMSLCHGWSSGVTAWLSEHVLGIRPSQPGGRTIEVNRNLGDLSWVEGAIPTPHGIVNARHVRNPDGSVATEIDGPKEVEIRVRPTA